MMAFPPPPPGMIYAYPTAQGYPGMPFAPGMALPAALVRPKRKQVKMACTNCASACKRCDEGRPCERCCKYGISDTCQDGTRKERKKGIKRGPYKRKSKVSADASYEGFPAEQNPTEGFYQPYFYPPAGFVTVGPDGQPMQGDPSGAQQGMTHPQYYSLHAPYPPYPFPHGPNGTYPVMGGHVLGQPGSSGADTEGASTSTGPLPPITAPISDADDGTTEGDSQTGSRGRKRKVAASPTRGQGSGAGGKDDRSSSKRAGKKAAVSNVDDTNDGGAMTGTAGAQGSSM
ncbi:hypothetical protein EW145_g349 [Phellinidium pouzarii]|uniref:Zn(2)-C6 fungal-type domain-containing protein n=1 Tax=Phellinidium pouzarii TaxID=167371 RepID=A0A4S4LIY5_9AGAM|nr:hypothetical protein EW145_g349 [Phellinidium pouzarii]